MRKYIRIASMTLVLIALHTGARAQTPPGNLWKWHLERGETLYRSGKYVEAHEELLKSEALRDQMNETEMRTLDYHLAMSAYRGGKAGALDRLREYLEVYPESAYVPYVRFAVGNTYFEREDYNNALSNYMALDQDKLNKPEKNEYNFKAGYCYFVHGEYERVVPYMSKVEFKSVYYSHAQYCLGYADYRAGDYTSAKRYFMNVSDSESYGRLIPFYLLQMEYNEGNYHYVTENGQRISETATGDRQRELARMIGEAWFRTSSWKKAVEYFDDIEAKGGTLDRQSNYMMGYSAYMLTDWDKAEEYLSRVPGQDDRLSQNASYHLGEVYLRLGDKPRAMQSFSIASNSNFDANVTEDALFNYGKLQYELGGGYFNEAINVLNRYLTEYPSSPRVPQVKEFLAAAYYNSRNFDAAYEAIIQMPNPDNNVRAALQKIAYFRALESFRKGDVEGASVMLEESLRNRYNAKYTALAGFWQGEVLYRRDDFPGAVEKFETYIRLSPRTETENLMARYNSGYAYFNMQDWTNARTMFDSFLLEYTPADSYRADTYNRLGDIEYSNRQFWRAIEFYDEALRLNTAEKYYSLYQRAMMLGMVERPDRKIESLRDIIKNNEGPYVADAMYELGRAYIAGQKYGDAAAAMEQFIAAYPSSPKYTQALLDLGLIYQNLNNNGRSLDYYKMVVESQKHSPEAREAMNGIRGIYVDDNNVNAYFSYARQVGIETDLGALQRDSLAFVAAQKVYLSGDNMRAATALNDYLRDYPQGAYVGNALYYAGENSIARGQDREAFDYFTRLTEMYNNAFTARGLERLGVLGMELGQYGAAATAYQKLSQGASTSAERDVALAGYLRATQMNGDAAQTENVANEIAAAASDKKLRREATFARAKALDQLRKGNEALSLYTQLSADVSDAAGAESAYRVIEAAHKRGEREATEKLIFSMAEANTPHAYWLAKSFLILGDIYAAAGDSFQARATYQSIVDGYSNTSDGIIEEAKERIKNLK